ncbi:hypothetical protein D3C78_989710 [compost metagenome]
MRFLIGKEKQVVTEEPHLLLERIKHFNKEGMGEINIQFAGKNNTYQIRFFSG